MMVPLRRYLIVKEHGVLRYLEGKACAEILQAGEKGGTSASKVFVGLGLGALFKALQAILGGAAARAGASTSRLDRDTPVGVLLAGALAIVVFIWSVPAFHMTLLGAFLILVLGFLFSVVSSRITGEVGSSSCPLSGMTIGVLMATCGAFLFIGWEGPSYSRLALMIGAIVCIAISNAGTCSQDLRTGFLVGATPVRQQGALLVGVLTSVLAVGWTAYRLNLAETTEKPVAAFAVAPALVAHAEDVESKADGHRYAFVRLTQDDVPQGVAPGICLVDGATNEARLQREDGIGAGRLQAPQAKLMSVVIDGLLTHKLPWDLILIGAAIAVFIELMGFRSLTFAVGVYLPISSTMRVFLGGVVRFLADRIYKRAPDAEDEPQGVLWCSGLIAGASILGIVAAMQGFLAGFDGETGLHPEIAVLARRSPALSTSDLFGLAVLVLLGWLMFRGAADEKRA